MTECSREPSGIVASTNGVLMSTRRRDMRSIRSTRAASSPDARIVVVSSLRPGRAMNTVALQRPEPGHPVTRSSTSRTTDSASPIGGSAEASERSE
jgi:hypothetical protein